MTDYEVAEDDVRDLLPRFRLVYVVLGLTFILLLGRLWYLQIMKGDELREYSERNRVKESKIAAARGLILDRNGAIVVDNVTGFDATITPQYAHKLEETAAAIAPVLGLETDKIIAEVRTSRRKSGPFFPAALKVNLNLDEVYAIERLKIDHPGLNIRESILRYYPLEENGAQVFGYVGEISRSELESLNRQHAGKVSFEQGAIVGKSGLEDMWDLTLRGRDGLSFIEVDAHGRESTAAKQSFFEVKPIKAEPGNSIVLTIDKDIQMAAYKAMLEQNDKIGPRIGGIVVMKTNGEILAWVSTPSFNPNKFARGISTKMWSQLTNDPFKPLRNKVIQDHYPPGSAIKPIIAVAGLQEGEITPNKIVNSPGQLRYGNRVYHDSLRQGHGDINVKQAIERSSNIFFYKLGIQLGIDNMAKYAKAMGLGARTGIELKEEARGEFPTKEWKLKTRGEPWQPGENLSNAIGQGFVLVNLLQLAVSYNAIANDGWVVKPFIVQKVIDAQQKVVREFKPEMIRNITELGDDGVRVDKQNLAVVREGMRLVNNSERGTARWWKIPGIEIAGKTGTSQVRSFSADEIYDKCDQRSISLRHHGIFVGYAPANNPEIVVAALTEHSCAGSSGSAPVVRDAMLAYFQKYNPGLIKARENIIKTPAPTPTQIDEVGE